MFRSSSRASVARVPRRGERPPASSRVGGSSNPRRLLGAARPLREVLDPLLGDGHDILVPDPHLPREVYPRLVGEAHPRPELGGVAADEVGPLVAVHADAVAKAMGEALVGGAEAAVRDDLAGGRVHRLAFHARPGGPEGRLLGLADELPDLALARGGGGAQDAGAGDVALVPEEAPPAVDQNHLPRS